MAMTASIGPSRTELVIAARRRRRFNNWAILFGVLLIVGWCVEATIIADTDWRRMGGMLGIIGSIQRFLLIDWSLVPLLVVPAIETLMMATLGTLLGCILALPVAWFGALNVTPSRLIFYPVGRFLMVLSRSIHEIIWAMLFVGAVGLGALPGILAVAMRSIGFISKITAEAIENIDRRSLEAIYAAGGSRLQVLRYAVVPQVLPTFTSVVIFEWDINIRRASVMGLVGAGGLGLTFYRQMAMFNYAGVTSVIVAILVLIGIGEVVSYLLRRRMI
jgi:phosphonate transport system permease protein